ncbi:MAG TPA: hypothetical protein VGO90_03595, partial [Chthoniobacteraceae bacterium]|nr:hypothetical protein [Chthoniobacteraceae bacterium]
MSNGSVAPEVEAPRSEAELGARRAAAATDHVARWWPWLAAVLSGAMVTAAFPPWNQGWLIWIALTPLLCAVWFGSAGARRPALRQAQLGWVAGFVFIVSTFYWLGTTLSALYKNPLLLAIPPLIGLYMGLYFAGWAWFVGTVLSARDATNKFPNS